MPNPFTEPLVGSGFDSLAAQRQFWAGFNNQIDTGNIARANAAEQNWNQGIAARNIALSQQNQMDFNAQQASEDQAYNRNWLAMQEATRQRELAQKMARDQTMWDQRLKEERRRTEALEKVNQDKLKFQAERQDEAIRGRATTFAMQYNPLVAARKISSDNLERLNAEDDDLAQRIDTLNLKPKRTAEEENQLATLRSQQRDLQKKLKTAQSENTKAETALATKVAQMGVMGFEPDASGNGLVHLDTGKVFPFVNPGSNTPSTTTETNAINPDFDERNVTRYWNGFGPTQPGTPPVAAAAPAAPASTVQPLSKDDVDRLIQEANNALRKAEENGLDVNAAREAIKAKLKAKYGIVIG